MDVGAPFREKVVTFGPGCGLVGVVTLPSEPLPRAPMVVLLNSGIIHRVGANRIYVAIARTLAGSGVTTLRFDLGGIGDSEVPAGAISLRQGAKRDIAAALDFLVATHGGERFVLAGLCSGAYDAFHTAVADFRVTGAVLLDIPGPFRGWRHHARHYGGRLVRPWTWRNPARTIAMYMKALPALRAAAALGAESAFSLGSRPTATRKAMATDLDLLLSRDVGLYFIFTAGRPDSYNHRSQFRSRFRRAAAHSALKVDFLADCDHTFSTRQSRARITGLVRDWVVDHIRRSKPPQGPGTSERTGYRRPLSNAPIGVARTNQ
jgi:hypothetical protein